MALTIGLRKVGVVPNFTLTFVRFFDDFES